MDQYPRTLLNGASFLPPIDEGPHELLRSIADKLTKQLMSTQNNHFDQPLEEFCSSALSFQKNNDKAIGVIYDDCIWRKFFVNSMWKPEALPVPHLKTVEERWAALFNQFLDNAGRGLAEISFSPLVDAYEWRSHDTKLIEGTRKPDVILVPKGRATPTFGSVLTDCEIKGSAKDPNILGASVQMLQLAGYVTNCQINRSFFLGAILCGHELSLILHARGNSFYSRSINIDESPKLFIKTILALSSGVSSVLGFDPAFRLSVGPQGPAYRILVQGLSGNKSEYRLHVTNQMYYRSYDMTGKGSKVAVCKDEEDTEDRFYALKETFLLSPGPNDVDNYTAYIKNTARRLSADEERIFGKTDAFKVFHDNVETFGTRRWGDRIHLRGIPVLVAAMVVHIPYYQAMDQDSTRTIALRFTKPPPSIEQRVHYRTVSETVGIPLSWFSCRREVINCVMAAGIGHFNGLLKGLLHCDPSEANTWLCVNNPLNPEDAVPDWPKDDEDEPDVNKYPKRSGVLGDWGMAELRRPGAPRRMPGGITGTYPFLAAELLSENAMKGQVRRESWHDLEALFWVLWIISVNSTGPYYQRREWISRPPPPPPPAPVPSPNSIGPPHQLSIHTMQLRTPTLRTPADAGGSSMGVPLWATPGLHENEAEAVFDFKTQIPKTKFLGCMSPYWRSDDEAGQAFRKGMLKLRERFVWTDDGPPSSPITHTEFITILKDMRDGIPAAMDRHGASEEVIKAARARYDKLLGSGQDLGVQLLDHPSPSLRKGRSTTSAKFPNSTILGMNTNSAKRPSEPSAAEQGPDKHRHSDHDEGGTQGHTQDNPAEPTGSTSRRSKRHSPKKKTGAGATVTSRMKPNPGIRPLRGSLKK